jgi:hypothetical protein
MINIIKVALRPLFVRTKYFMVFYIATHPDGKLTGQTSFAIRGIYPFLNKIKTEEYLQKICPECKDFVITGFIKLNKFEYTQWLKG